MSVASMRATIAPEMHRQPKARHPDGHMTPEEWKQCLLDYTGPVDTP